MKDALSSSANPLIAVPVAMLVGYFQLYGPGPFLLACVFGGSFGWRVAKPSRSNL